MTTINADQKIVTLINTFTVAPEKQGQLIALLNEATEKVMKNFDGFISANIHRGVEGNKVANYAQWESKEKMMAIFKDPVAQRHMKEAAALAESFEPLIYEVNTTHGKN